MSAVVGARPALATDRDVLERLASLAADEARTQRGGPLLLDFDRIGQPSDEAPVEHSFVGTIDDVVVGWAQASIERRGTNVVALMHVLFVHPDAREVGVAASLLAAVQATAESAGCTHIESEVLPGNRAAKNFFERMGMITRKMRVSAPLGRAVD